MGWVGSNFERISVKLEKRNEIDTKCHFREINKINFRDDCETK